MPRRRLGVALLITAPIAAEVQGLRRALGDPARDQVVPHLTLLAPVNVRDDDLDEALAVVTAAAGRARPLHLALGPVTTFAPVTHTVHLAVAGPDLDDLGALRADVRRPPLARPDIHDWVPHVTLAAEAAPDRVAGAVAALDDFYAEMVLDRVHVLVQHPDRGWRPLVDVELGPPAPSGRGGFEVAVTVSEGPGPDATALLGARGLTTTARIGGAVVGAARGFATSTTLVVVEVAVAVGHRRLGVGRRLLTALEAEAAARGCVELVAAGVADPATRALLADAGWRAVDDEGGDDPSGWRRRLR